MSKVERVMVSDMKSRSSGWKWRSGAMMAGLLAFGLLAGCSSTSKNDTFDLTPATVTSAPRATKARQILIADPSALKALDSEQIVVRVSPSEIQYLANSQWSDRLPRVVQSNLVEAFENSGRIAGVGKPGQGLAIDYQVVTDIRAFEIETTGNRAVVEISVKLLNDRNGSVRDQQVFRAVVPTGGSDSSAYVRGLNRAFANVSQEIVTWTLSKI